MGTRKDLERERNFSFYFSFLFWRCYLELPVFVRHAGHFGLQPLALLQQLLLLRVIQGRAGGLGLGRRAVWLGHVEGGRRLAARVHVILQPAMKSWLEKGGGERKKTFAGVAQRTCIMYGVEYIDTGFPESIRFYCIRTTSLNPRKYNNDKLFFFFIDFRVPRQDILK